MYWTEYNTRLFGEYKKRELPYHIAFEITPFCNFKCNMCYIRLDPGQEKKVGNLLSTSAWIKIAEEAKKAGAISLEITGGEATTRADFPILYKSFIKMGYLIILRSNGYLISGELLELLKRYNPRVVCVTLYGASDETYKRVCGINNGYSIVTRNLLAMRDAGIRVQLSMTMTNENIEDAKPLRAWAADNHLHFRTFGGLFSPIGPAKRSIDHLRINYFSELDALIEEPVGFHRDIENVERYMKPFWRCSIFGGSCSISWDGRMKLCNAMDGISKRFIPTDFIQTYHNLYDELKKIKRPVECKTCQYIDFCIACPMRFYSETGNPEQTCDSICKMARKLYFIYSTNKTKYESEQDALTNELTNDQC